LVRPTDLEENCDEIKVPKRGRPRKIVSDLSKNETKLGESSKQIKPEDVIQYTLIFAYFFTLSYFYRL